MIPFSYLTHWLSITGKLAEIMHWSGLVILLLTTSFALYVHSLFPKKHDKLGDFERLLKEGPCRYVRQPFYLSFIIMGFGISLFCTSIPGFLAYGMMLPLWVKLADIEERELLEYWGEEYREFMKTRRRPLPKSNKKT